MEKEAIRNHIRSLKKQMTRKEMEEQSNQIIQNLYQIPAFQQTKNLYLYVSYNQEVMTESIIKEALSIGKNVAVPRVEQGNISFYYIKSLDDLAKGYQGISEPVTKESARENEIFMIVPGLAFDRSGNRLGYGGGFYDRYMLSAGNKIKMKVALAYDFQILDHVHTEKYDQTIDKIITPSMVITCNS